jgi:translation elongation factor P/translation initiation factor 5A
MNFELTAGKSFSDIKKGEYVLYDFFHSKTGKHGSMKVRLIMNDCVTGKKTESVMPGHTAIRTFKPIKQEYQLMDMTDDDIAFVEIICIDTKKNESITLEIVKNDQTSPMIHKIKKIMEDGEKYIDVNISSYPNQTSCNNEDDMDHENIIESYKEQQEN